MERVNREYYLTESPGRTDYWKKMAAPRFRMEVFLEILSKHAMASLIDLGCGNGELLQDVRFRFPDRAVTTHVGVATCRSPLSVAS